MSTITGQLVKKVLIKGHILAKTGLHIGGSNTALSIGGADATVVRNPLTNQPYIPGSSLKGKMRSLLERLYALEHQKSPNSFGFGGGVGGNVQAGPFDNYDHIITKIFGTTPEKMQGVTAPPSRLIVRDAHLTNESKEKLEKAKNTDMPFTEVKTEVVIDRITSAAVPRQLERVPAGAEFAFEIILNIYDGDEENNMIDKVLEGLVLVNDDYLGGKGTRGSGEVKITVEALSYKTLEEYQNNDTWKDANHSLPVGLK